MRKRQPLSIAACALALFASALPVQANQYWSFSYNDLLGPGTTSASGILETAGAASTYEPVLSISGTWNGAAITGLVPVGGPVPGAYSSFWLNDCPSAGAGPCYDNLFTSSSPQVDYFGLLFTVSGQSEPVNLYRDYSGPGISEMQWGRYYEIIGVSLNVAPIPEPETYAMLLAGLGVLGLIARRRKINP